MSPLEVGKFIDNLVSMGLQPMAGKAWNDVAVVDSIFKRPTAPCDWVHVGQEPKGRVFACLIEHRNDPGMICIPERRDEEKPVN
jgi:hypothetical protein